MKRLFPGILSKGSAANGVIGRSKTDRQVVCNQFDRHSPAIKNTGNVCFFWVKFIAVASLVPHVLVVVCNCSVKQVKGIYARWIVAIMKNIRLFWRQWSEVYYPTCNVGQQKTVPPRPHGNSAVPLSVEECFPYPALTKMWTMIWDWSVFINMFPKSAFERNRKALREGWILCNVGSGHNQVIVDCVFAPRRFSGDAGAFSFLPETI